MKARKDAAQHIRHIKRKTAEQRRNLNIFIRSITLAIRRGQAEIDTIQTALEIDKHLSDLENAARAHGSAVGSAFLYPISIERIALWSKGLEKRGFVLVPVSAILSPPTK